MKNKALTVLFLWLASLCQAQTNLQVKMKDGSRLTIPTYQIKDIRFQKLASASLEGLTGNWRLIASNDGVEVAPGVFSAGNDTILFTATPSSDGTYLECHTDRLHWRTSTVYTADWRMVVEQQGEQRRIGWVLDSQQPAWTGNNRYLYFLSENSDVTALIGMTFWSPWSSLSATSYALSNAENNSHKIYGILSDSQPFGKNLGWIEIWSSPRFEKLP